MLSKHKKLQVHTYMCRNLHTLSLTHSLHTKISIPSLDPLETGINFKHTRGYDPNPKYKEHYWSTEVSEKVQSSANTPGRYGCSEKQCVAAG